MCSHEVFRFILLMPNNSSTIKQLVENKALAKLMTEQLFIISKARGIWFIPCIVGSYLIQGKFCLREIFLVFSFFECNLSWREMKGKLNDQSAGWIGTYLWGSSPKLGLLLVGVEPWEVLAQLFRLLVDVVLDRRHHPAILLMVLRMAS